MSRRWHSIVFWCILVSNMLLALTGCGGNSSSDQSNSATTRAHSLALQLARAPETVGVVRRTSNALSQPRQAQRGEAGYVERVDIHLRAQGGPLLAPQSFFLTDADQETVSLELALPPVLPDTFQVLVSAFNNFNNTTSEIFRGDVLVQRTQANAVVSLVRQALVPAPATPPALQQTTFGFIDGTAFGVTGPFTLAAGTFVGNTGDFTLVAGGFIASGQVTIGSCIFSVTSSSFLPGQGPQAGTRIVIDPCQVDAIDGRLIATNAVVSTTQTSEAPIVVPPSSALLLPATPPTLVTNSNTPATTPIDVRVVGQRAGRLTFAITTLPRNGNATVDPAGLLTYQPNAGFQGNDPLVVTAILLFTDGNAPPLLLGTVPVSITVRPATTLPVMATPGDQTTQEGATVSLLVQARDAAGNPLPLRLQVTGLPPGLTFNASTGRISGIIASGASAHSPYQVTITVVEDVNQSRVVFLWTVLPPNRPPALTNPGAQLSTVQDQVTLQIIAMDPDGPGLTFSALNLPPGLQIDAATGVIRGTIAPNAATGSPFTVTVTVTDNGNPPLSVSVMFVWKIRSHLLVLLGLPNGPVAPNSTFTVPVIFGAGPVNIISYLLEITFDPRIVVITGITQDDPAFDPPVTNPGAFQSGQVRFAANNSRFVSATGPLVLANVTFQVVGTPGADTLVQLRFPPQGALVDEMFQALTGINFRNGQIRVN